MTDFAAAISWLAERISKGPLYQEEAVAEIAEKFGASHVIENESGNLAIAPELLRAFRKETPKNIVWDRLERAWRTREKSDAPGRRQA